MAKSIKLKNNNYIDSTGVVHNRELLSNILNNQLNDSGWINITTFYNDATTWDTNFNPPRYRKIGHQVFLEGLFTSGNDYTVQFQLPEGFRPSGNYTSFTQRHGLGSCIIYINQGAKNGFVVIQQSTKGTETSLFGISFFVD